MSSDRSWLLAIGLVALVGIFIYRTALFLGRRYCRRQESLL